MNKIEKIGKKVGCVFSYFLFTTILFFALGFLNKLPTSWTYFHIAAITVLISSAGIVLRRFLYGNAKAIF